MTIRYWLCLVSFIAGTSLFAEADAPRDGEQTARVVEVDREVLILDEAPPNEQASEEEKASYWERVRQQYEAAKTKSAALMDKTKDAAGDMVDKTKDAAGDVYDKTKGAAGDAYRKTKDVTADAYRKTKDATVDAYESARDTTTGWYEGARDWTQDDLKRAGAWQYRVIVINREDIRSNPQMVEEMLGELGNERFECFWVEPLNENNSRLAFFFKKSGFSYLKSIPAKEFWRFLPNENGDDGGGN